MRYRHGNFFVIYPDVHGEVVFSSVYGDSLQGCGLPQSYLDAGLEAIERAIKYDRQND
jgi:hypothetical protein